MRILHSLAETRASHYDGPMARPTKIKTGGGTISLAPLTLETALKAAMSTGKAPPPPKRPKRKAKK
jgi:hypothetical protein